MPYILIRLTVMLVIVATVFVPGIPQEIAIAVFMIIAFIGSEFAAYRLENLEKSDIIKAMILRMREKGQDNG